MCFPSTNSIVISSTHLIKYYVTIRKYSCSLDADRTYHIKSSNREWSLWYHWVVDMLLGHETSQHVSNIWGSIWYVYNSYVAWLTISDLLILVAWPIRGLVANVTATNSLICLFNCFLYLILVKVVTAASLYKIPAKMKIS